MNYVKAIAEKLLRAAVGFHEHGNNGNPYSQWQYGVEYPGGGWCCSFASWVAYNAGFRFGADAQYGDKGFASTNVAQPWAERHGLWRPTSWRAQVGDWVIFNWDGGGTDHVEVVVYDDGVRIITIGGNTGNAVAWRTRDRRYVSGFVALSQSAQAAPAAPSPEVIAYLKKLAAWETSMAVPVGFGDPASSKLIMLNQLLVDASMMAPPVHFEWYGKNTRAGVWHVKKLLGDVAPDGRSAGPRVAHWLIHRGK